MAKRHGYIDNYWLDNVAKTENIGQNLPVYAVGPWTNFLHTLETFQGWQRLRTPNKWLRSHTTHEWHGYYTPEHVDDLHKFFEKYLNDADHHREQTPRVRLFLSNLDMRILSIKLRQYVN